MNDLKDVSTRGAIIATAIGLIVIALVIGVFAFRSNSLSNEKVDSKKYQAVVLRNGQVYFGKLSNLGSAYATLSDVYYIKNEQGAGATPSPDGSNLTLVKLGDELPQSDQEMQIANGQIVYFETMSDDSKVSEAIKKAKDQNK